MQKPMLLAFDTETSGLTNDHSILSMGAVTEDWRWFYKEIKWKNVLVSPSAMAVNQIDLRQNTGIPWDAAVLEFHKWLTHQFPGRVGGDIIPIGFNVGSFDVRMMKKEYPVGFETSFIGRECAEVFPFHYRSIELNSLIYLFGLDKSEFSRQMWSQTAEEMKINGIPGEATTHNALADAVFAMVCWKEFQKRTLQKS